MRRRKTFPLRKEQFLKLQSNTEVVQVGCEVPTNFRTSQRISEIGNELPNRALKNELKPWKVSTILHETTKGEETCIIFIEFNHFATYNQIYFPCITILIYFKLV